MGEAFLMVAEKIVGNCADFFWADRRVSGFIGDLGVGIVRG
jgi:hypothetical protein